MSDGYGECDYTSNLKSNCWAEYVYVCVSGGDIRELKSGISETLFHLFLTLQKNMLPSIEQLNTASNEAFIEAVNTLFETAPPLASRLLAARPYKSYIELIDFAQNLCLGNELTNEEKLEVINAHPRIGASKANLSAMSLKEQGYSDRQNALSKEDEEINATLARLNEV